MDNKRLVQVHYGNTTIDGAEQIDPALVEATGHAEPTSRVLDGSEDHGYAEEWQEPAVMPDGRPCLRMYLFDDDEVCEEEAENYPWDDDHVKRIVLLD